MNHDTTREFSDDALTAEIALIESDPAEAEYADEYTLNDIGLALRVHAFAESE